MVYFTTILKNLPLTNSGFSINQSINYFICIRQNSKAH